MTKQPAVSTADLYFGILDTFVASVTIAGWANPPFRAPLKDPDDVRRGMESLRRIPQLAPFAKNEIALVNPDGEGAAGAVAAISSIAAVAVQAIQFSERGEPDAAILGFFHHHAAPHAAVIAEFARVGRAAIELAQAVEKFAAPPPPPPSAPITLMEAVERLFRRSRDEVKRLAAAASDPDARKRANNLYGAAAIAARLKRERVVIAGVKLSRQRVQECPAWREHFGDPLGLTRQKRKQEPVALPSSMRVQEHYNSAAAVPEPAEEPAPGPDDMSIDQLRAELRGIIPAKLQAKFLEPMLDQVKANKSTPTKILETARMLDARDFR